MKGNIVSNVIGALVIIVLVGATLGIIADKFIGTGVVGNASASNITGATATLAPIVPVILLISVLLAVLGSVGVYKFKS